ncbi:MAG: putative solute:sodium symporter small subunit [Planctomycetota bacterium]|jgi:putative solute:sodium symporter small subunit
MSWKVVLRLTTPSAARASTTASETGLLTPSRTLWYFSAAKVRQGVRLRIAPSYPEAVQEPITSQTDESEPPTTDKERRRLYWRQNLIYLGVLLSIWAFVSFGCGILFVDYLNRFQLPGTGFPLGFWFAQQGSIYVFVVLILVYVQLMNRLDRKYDFDEE